MSWTRGSNSRGSSFLCNRQRVPQITIRVSALVLRKDPTSVNATKVPPRLDACNERPAARFGAARRNPTVPELTSGHVRITVDDHAFAIGHIGYIGKNLNLLDAKLCLIGNADYELNLLQVSSREVKFFDSTIKTCRKERWGSARTRQN